LDSLAKSSVHFDERMGINQKKLLRPKRPGFQFVEEGKLTRQAELQKIKVCKDESLFLVLLFIIISSLI
jgi:U4/U6 small nuclear ribonucleoprotein PRP3